MAPKSQKQSTNEKNTSDRSLKKYLAVATMAASLGVSLGVPVGDALAQDETLSSPPGYTTRDSQREAFENLEISTQSDSDQNTTITKDSKQIKLNKMESRQGKFKSNDSTQIKLDKMESRQGKFKSKDSTQIKLDKQIDTDMEADQTKVNE